MPLDGLCLEFFRDFSKKKLGGSVGQIIYRVYIVFRGLNISVVWPACRWKGVHTCRVKAKEWSYVPSSLVPTVSG